MRGQEYRDNYADYQIVYYEDEPLSKCYCVVHKFYTYELASSKINVNKGTIATRDRKMIETLDYWLAENTDLSDDNIYLYIRLKSTNNPDFLKWWNDYNFKIRIERNGNFYEGYRKQVERCLKIMDYYKKKEER